MSFVGWVKRQRNPKKGFIILVNMSVNPTYTISILTYKTHFSKIFNVESALRPNSSGAYCRCTSEPGQMNVPGVTERTK